LTMGIFLVASVVMFLIAFGVSKERIQPDPKQDSSVLQDLSDLVKNGPWIALFLVVTFYFIATMIRNSVMLPYFKYCAGNQILFSWFNGFGLTALLIGVACSTSLTKRFGKRTLFFWSMLLTGLLCGALFFLPAKATAPIFGLEVVRQFIYGCSGPLLWAMMGDVADYGEWKTGRRATATVTSAVVFALWIGLALGGALAGWLLSLYGYQSNAVQSEHALLGIRLIASAFSGAAFLAAAVCLLFYGITMKLNMTISHDLSERRKDFSSPSA
jgi:GPH family glycoside/pentoside/hexuronide:cation symporter